MVHPPMKDIEVLTNQCIAFSGRIFGVYPQILLLQDVQLVNSMFDFVLFEDCNTKNPKTGQDASAWETKGLVLTKCRFLSKARAFSFRYFGNCDSMKCILVEELKISLVIGQS